MLDAERDRQAQTQYRRHIRKKSARDLAAGRFHFRHPVLWIPSIRVREIEASPSARCTPACYSRVNLAITVPTTGDGSRATKIDSYSRLNEASSIVAPFIAATRLTT